LLVADFLHPFDCFPVQRFGDRDVASTSARTNSHRDVRLRLGAKASANRLLVLVGSGGINVAISDLDSVNDTSFTFGRISYLKNAEPKNENLNAVV